MTRWHLTTTDGEGMMLSQQSHDEWEVRAIIERAAGDVKVRGFGPTETDAKDCCMRNLMEEMAKCP